MTGRPKKQTESDVVAVFKALADRSRCQILELLQESGELRVGDIAAGFEMSHPAVTKHIKVLETANLVTRRREGVTHFISANRDGLAPVEQWLDVQTRSWDRRLDALEEALQTDEE